MPEVWIINRVSPVKQIYLITVLFVVNGLNAQYAEAGWEDRDQWMPLEELFEMADLSKGMDVADIGCHEGYLSFHLAEHLGKFGTVYAVDVRADRIKAVEAIAEDREVKNIVPILGMYDDPRLTDGVMDRIFIVDTYHEIGDYVEYLKNLKSALKPNGKLIILEKLKTEHSEKTRQQQAYFHTLSMDFVKRELKDAGYRIIDQRNDMGFWENNQEKIIWVVVAELR